MFEKLFGKKEPPPQRNSVKEVLYGDMPMEVFPGDSANDAFPWSSFIAAREHLKAGRKTEAIAEWRKITDAPGQESLVYLQAWHFLRQNGAEPSAEDAKRILGVIVEIGSSGVLIAAYADHQARLYADTGNSVIWLHPDSSLDTLVDGVLDAATKVVPGIAPWNKPRLPMPSEDIFRISILTPSGLHFGQGPVKVLTKDPLANLLLQQGHALMHALIQLHGKTK